MLLPNWLFNFWLLETDKFHLKCFIRRERDQLTMNALVTGRYPECINSERAFAAASRTFNSPSLLFTVIHNYPKHSWYKWYILGILGNLVPQFILTKKELRFLETYISTPTFSKKSLFLSFVSNRGNRVPHLALETLANCLSEKAPLLWYQPWALRWGRRLPASPQWRHTCWRRWESATDRAEPLSSSTNTGQRSAENNTIILLFKTVPFSASLTL